MSNTEIKSVKIRNLVPWMEDGNAYDYTKCVPGDIVLTTAGDNNSIHVCIPTDRKGADFVTVTEDVFLGVKGANHVFEILKARANRPEYHHKRFIKDTGLEEIEFTYKVHTDNEGYIYTNEACAFYHTDTYVRQKKADAREYRKIKEFGVF